MENNLVETYQEEWEYSWVKSKSKSWYEIEAVRTFSKLMHADMYKANTLIYVIDEKQVYRAKHKRVLRYLGKVV